MDGINLNYYIALHLTKLSQSISSLHLYSTLLFLSLISSSHITLTTSDGRLLLSARTYSFSGRLCGVRAEETKEQQRWPETPHPIRYSRYVRPFQPSSLFNPCHLLSSDLLWLTLLYLQSGVYSGGPHGKRRDEAGHTQDKYFEFLDFIE